MKKIKLKISGMHCDSCAKMIEMDLEDKVKRISVSQKQGKADVEFDEKKISEEKIKEIITKLGYKVI